MAIRRNFILHVINQRFVILTVIVPRPGSEEIILLNIKHIREEFFRWLVVVLLGGGGCVFGWGLGFLCFVLVLIFLF